MTHKKEKFIKNIVQKIVGQSGQLYLIFVSIVEKKSKQTKALIGSFVIWIVGIKLLLVESYQKTTLRKLVRLLRVKYQKMLGNLEANTPCGTQIEQTKKRDLQKNIWIGSMQLLKEINILAKYVEINAQVVRSFMLTTLSRLLNIQNYGLRLETGEYCVPTVIEKHQPIVEKYCDVIRTRYENFINNRQKTD